MGTLFHWWLIEELHKKNNLICLLRKNMKLQNFKFMRQQHSVPLSELSWLQKSSLLQHLNPVSLHCIGKSNSGRKKLFLSKQLQLKWKKLISFSDHYIFQRILSLRSRKSEIEKTIFLVFYSRFVVNRLSIFTTDFPREETYSICFANVVCFRAIVAVTF